MLVRRRVRCSRWADDDRRLGGRQVLRAPTGRGRDGTAGRVDAVRNARRVSDRLGAQYRDCDGFQSSVVDDRRRCGCVAFRPPETAERKHWPSGKYR